MDREERSVYTQSSANLLLVVFKSHKIVAPQPAKIKSMPEVSSMTSNDPKEVINASMILQTLARKIG